MESDTCEDFPAQGLQAKTTASEDPVTTFAGFRGDSVQF